MPAPIGLLYGTVALAPHTREWERLFALEAARLSAALADWECVVEHVGSTAVADLSAKPIIDIAVGVPVGTSPEAVVPALVALGYDYRGDAGRGGGRVLVREAAPRVRTHHLHVVLLGGDQWDRYLAFRDLLRVKSDARETYRREKEALALLHAGDRRAYTAGKAEVIARLLGEERRA
jgi:GrpB-like predicted nucleotidyltransferase (UPF0157 family)